MARVYFGNNSRALFSRHSMNSASATSGQLC